MTPAFSRNEIAAALDTLPGWSLDPPGTGIERVLVFADFSEAFAFMTRVALKAEAMNHHPEWRNVYRRVQVRLSTHDAGGVSALDIELARYINRLAPAVEANV